MQWDTFNGKGFHISGMLDNDFHNDSIPGLFRTDLPEDIVSLDCYTVLAWWQ